LNVITRLKNNSYLLAATPIGCALIQFVALVYRALHRVGNRADILGYGGLYVAALLLPALSIPALVLSIRRYRANEQRSVSMTAAILNGAYATLLFFGLFVLLAPMLGHGDK
jgi:hypothetical protein